MLRMSSQQDIRNKYGFSKASDGIGKNLIERLHKVKRHHGMYHIDAIAAGMHLSQKNGQCGQTSKAVWPHCPLSDHCCSFSSKYLIL